MLRLGMRTSRFSIRNMLQHVATGWPSAWNMLRPTILRSVALKCCDRLARACKCWANNVGIRLRRDVAIVWLGLKPQPNDHNMPTQHIATLLGATCCVRLATVLRHVATCWVLLGQFWPFSNLSQQLHPTCRNMSQHGGQTHTTCCAQQCCDMLRWHVAIVWPGLYR